METNKTIPQKKQSLTVKAILTVIVENILYACNMQDGKVDHISEKSERLMGIQPFILR